MKAKNIEYQMESKLSGMGGRTPENPFGTGIQQVLNCLVHWDDDTTSFGKEDVDTDDLGLIKQSAMKRAFNKAKIAKMLLQDKKAEPSLAQFDRNIFGGMSAQELQVYTQAQKAQIEMASVIGMQAPKTFHNTVLNDPYAASQVMLSKGSIS